jgi:hypothetical protein
VPKARVQLWVLHEKGEGLWSVASGGEWIPCTTRKGAIHVGRTIGRLIEAAGGNAELMITEKKGGVITAKESYGYDPVGTKG